MFKIMKAPIIVLICAFLFSGCASNILGKHDEQDVIHDTPNLTKAQVYDTAHKWFISHYSNDQSKIIREDTSSGILIASGVARIGGLMIVRNVEYKIKIEAKENEFHSYMKVIKYFDTDIKGDFLPEDVTQTQINNAHQVMSEIPISLEMYINEIASNDKN